MERYLDVAERINNSSALTQEQGDVIYMEIVAAFQEQQRIVLDFSNVKSMISPFLNNAIGQLYGEYNSEVIKEFLELKDFPQNKVATLNVVINNAKKFYANKSNFMQKAKDVLDIE